MPHLLEQLVTIVVFAVLWYFASLVIHLFFNVANLYDKVKYVLHVPKRKSMSEKTSPIYRLVTWEILSKMYIEKWELAYDINWTLTMIAWVVPWPGYVKTWRYVEVGSVYVCDEKDVMKIGDDLKTTYEELHEKKMEKKREEKKKIDEKSDKINSLNEEFDANIF